MGFTIGLGRSNNGPVDVTGLSRIDNKLRLFALKTNFMLKNITNKSTGSDNLNWTSFLLQGH